jgi:hypothetical protein
VKEEIEQADDPVSTAIAAAAAVGVMSSLSSNSFYRNQWMIYLPIMVSRILI